MKARPHDCVPVEATQPVYTLYTSGTTGTPKVNVVEHFHNTLYLIIFDGFLCYISVGVHVAHMYTHVCLSDASQAVVRPSGGHAVVLKWSMKAIYGINPGKTGRIWLTTVMIHVTMFFAYTYFIVLTC